jgi:hypothetical protein
MLALIAGTKGVKLIAIDCRCFIYIEKKEVIQEDLLKIGQRV